MSGHRLEHDRQALLPGVIVKWSSTPCSPLFWLQACLLFFCFSSSYAATCPSPIPKAGASWWGWGSNYYSDPTSACSDSGRITVNVGSTTDFEFDHIEAVDSTTYKCYARRKVGAGVFYASNTSRADVCPAGTTENAGMCVYACAEPCPSSGTVKKDTIALSGISGQQGIGASMCAAATGADCGIKCNSGIASYNDVSGQSSVYCESYEYTGATCTNTSLVATPVSTVPSTIKATPVNDPPKSREDCPGGSGFAQVNNVGMCLPSGTQFSGGSSTTTSTSGSVTTTSTTTVNPGGTNTTTTTTTYKDGSGNVTYSGTTTGTDGINQAGNNGQGGEKLNLGDAPVFDQSLPTETNFNIKAQGNPVFSTEIFATSASCPAPITFSAMGKDFNIDFSPICALADIIRGIVLMLSAIVAMRAVVTK